MAMCLCALSLGLAACSDGGVKAPDYSNLVAENHPRVIYTDADFEAIAHEVAEGTNPYLTDIHNIILETAASYLGAPALERIVIADFRLLAVSRAAEKRVLSCVYAYKTTGDRRFFDQAVFDVETLCKFENWNALRHFLDAGELAATVGLAYDWLYNDLADSTKVLARKALNEFAFKPATEIDGLFNFYHMTNNWNSVCNGGLVCAALATYEDNPEISNWIVEKALESNVEPMEVGYSPDGNYTEGYVYWNYGTIYEALLLTALETATGSDNGLSAIEGFSNSGKFIIYMEGPSGYCFNFSDCRPWIIPNLPQWYFAWKFGDLSVLYGEKDKVSEMYGMETVNDDDAGSRLLPLIAWYASKVDVSNISAPKEHIFYGRGENPVVLVHDTWTKDENDKFLGVKAGKASNGHGHMDAGSFVFDAEGVRWAADLGAQDYESLEPYLQIWDPSDEGERWQVFRYNNFNHNTLTVNDSHHKVAGEAKFLEVLDSDGKRGAVIDITSPLEGEVAEAVRTIYIEGDALVVEDKVTALEDKPANVRWTMVTPSEVKAENDGVTLSQKDKTRRLTGTSSTGHGIQWCAWPAQSSNPWDAPNPGFNECGYTVTVNAGETACITVKLIP